MQKEQFGTIWADQIDVHSIDQPGLSDPNGSPVTSEQHKKVLKTQSDYGKIPALASLDCEVEGAGNMCRDLPLTCRPLATGACDSEELAEELGRCIAKELRCAGANWRWAPVVDVSNRFALGFMRAFAQDDPDKVIRLSNAHIRGMQAEGVAATAKHFPGGGIKTASGRDSHFTAQHSDITKEEWWERQGKVYQGLIDSGVYSVMPCKRR